MEFILEIIGVLILAGLVAILIESIWPEDWDEDEYID